MTDCPPCDFCGQQPCDQELFGEQIAEECDECLRMEFPRMRFVPILISYILG
jgi:hypothetical protein